jgi:hypothetical protein
MRASCSLAFAKRSNKFGRGYLPHGWRLALPRALPLPPASWRVGLPTHLPTTSDGLLRRGPRLGSDDLASPEHGPDHARIIGAISVSPSALHLASCGPWVPGDAPKGRGIMGTRPRATSVRVPGRGCAPACHSDVREIAPGSVVGTTMSAHRFVTNRSGQISPPFSRFRVGTAPLDATG